MACTRMPLRPQLVGQVAHARLQRRLHRSHDAVVRHDLVRRRSSSWRTACPPSVISGAASRAMRTNEWQDTSMATPKPAAEQLSRPPCRSSLGAKAMECRAMSSRPQRSADALEHRLQLPRPAARRAAGRSAPPAPGQRLDVRPGLVVQVGDGQLGAELAERAGAAEGDRVLVGDAEDQGLLVARMRRRGDSGMVVLLYGLRQRAGAGCAGRSSAPRWWG